MRLGLPSFAVFAKEGKYTALLKVLKHGIMRDIFRKNREKHHAKAHALRIFFHKNKKREKKCVGYGARENQKQNPGGNPPDPFFLLIILFKANTP
ncbi:MAG: hypothetical protein H7829_05780 [Magnetococcus sp. THC-1_WYH]